MRTTMTTPPPQPDPRKFPFPPAIPAAALLLAWTVERLVPLPLPWPAWTRWAGWVLLTVPVLLAIWASSIFRRHRTTVHPRGQSTQIVTAGPFRYTRNPMYLSLVLLYLGGTLVLHLTWGLILLPAVFLSLHLGVILPEERYLASRFGPDYDQYKHRVRRWI
jgi:protein-S-isoprenylcysteine O-methyltransferase Ste14